VKRWKERLVAWTPPLAAVAIVGIGLVVLAALGGRTLPERTGPPAERLAVERTQLSPDTIVLTVRNLGPDPVQVAQAFVNDSYVDFAGGSAPIHRLGTGTLRLRYPWLVGQPYEISILTSTGAVIEHEVPVATPTSRADAASVGTMALLGAYVGVVPVVMGMLFLPAMRRLGRRGVRVLLALTVGLLVFLGVDASIEGLHAAGGDGAFGGPVLVVLGALLAFLALAAVDERLGRGIGGPRSDRTAAGYRLALMITIGIGLHNLGEGLAIGAAYSVGELALGTALVVGFTLQNTTEGLAVVAPLTEERPRILRLAGLGVVAGAPAIPGALLGASVTNAELSAFLLGAGVGAIAQVVTQLVTAMRGPDGRLLDRATVGGTAIGLVVMYLTGLLVTV
jgi:zinc transporter ZupT